MSLRSNIDKELSRFGCYRQYKAPERLDLIKSLSCSCSGTRVGVSLYIAVSKITKNRVLVTCFCVDLQNLWNCIVLKIRSFQLCSQFSTWNVSTINIFQAFSLVISNILTFFPLHVWQHWVLMATWKSCINTLGTDAVTFIFSLVPSVRIQESAWNTLIIS